MKRTAHCLAAMYLAFAFAAQAQQPKAPVQRQQAQKAAPAAPSRYGGSWSGKTDEGQEFSFEVSNGRITTLSVGGVISGYGCSVKSSTKVTLSRPITGNSFSVDTHAGPGGVSVTATGSFTSPTRARGTVVMTLHSIPGPPPGVPGYVPSCGGTSEGSWIADRVVGGQPSGKAQGSLPSNAKPEASPKPALAGVYNADSRGWSSVFGGMAQGQYFLSTAPKVTAIALRVAKLNDNTPEAPLEVEVRDESLENIYAHGTIAPTKARLEFQWMDVVLDHVARIEQSKTYILLMHSQKTTERAPWLVNTVYRDVYPQGRHLGYGDDLFFKIVFDAAHVLLVGPSAENPGLPFSSGTPTMGRVSGPPTLEFPTPHPAVADNDPVGPVPAGRYVGKDR
jgi:hypothetical protein